jgi:hypothetical protein
MTWRSHRSFIAEAKLTAPIAKHIRFLKRHATGAFKRVFKSGDALVQRTGSGSPQDNWRGYA